MFLPPISYYSTQLFFYFLLPFVVLLFSPAHFGGALPPSLPWSSSPHACLCLFWTETATGHQGMEATGGLGERFGGCKRQVPGEDPKNYKVGPGLFPRNSPGPGREADDDGKWARAEDGEATRQLVSQVCCAGSEKVVLHRWGGGKLAPGGETWLAVVMLNLVSCFSAVRQ